MSVLPSLSGATGHTPAETIVEPGPSSSILDRTMTFGVEIEFHLIYPLGLLSDPAYQDSKCPPAELLYRHLQEAGVSVRSYDDVLETGYQTYYSKWQVDVDNHCLLSDQVKAMPSGYESIGCEVSSPRFFLNNEEEWMLEIDKVLSVIKSLKDHDIRAVTNMETGLHCHIGNAHQVVPLRAAKNLLQLVTGFERCFDLLHTCSRIQHSHDDCAPPSRFFTKGGSQNPEDWLRQIEAVDTHEDLRALFQVPVDSPEAIETDGTWSAYNFDNLAPTNPNIKNTIEFRQHEGTLDYARIVNWIELCTATFRAASLVNPLRLIQLLRLHMHNGDFGIMDLMQTLDVPEPVRKFYLSRIGVHYENGKPINEATESFRRDFHASDQASNPALNPWRNLCYLLERDDYMQGNSVRVAKAIVHKFNTGGYGAWTDVSRFQRIRLPVLPENAPPAPQVGPQVTLHE